MRRVVVTGMAGLTALGGTWPEIRAQMEAGRTGTRYMPEWERLTDLNTKIGGAIDWFDHSTAYHRKKTRSMGRVAVMALYAAERALEQAALSDHPVLQSGRAGVSCGSSFGATEAMDEFAGFMATGKAKSLNATSYIRMMSHTAPVNTRSHWDSPGGSSRPPRPARRDRKASVTPLNRFVTATPTSCWRAEPNNCAQAWPSYSTRCSRRARRTPRPQRRRGHMTRIATGW